MWLPFFMKLVDAVVFVYTQHMSSAENKKIIETAFTAWSQGDGMAVFNLIADHVEWTITGN